MIITITNIAIVYMCHTGENHPFVLYMYVSWYKLSCYKIERGTLLDENKYVSIDYRLYP